MSESNKEINNINQIREFILEMGQQSKIFKSLSFLFWQITPWVRWTLQ